MTPRTAALRDVVVAGLMPIVGFSLYCDLLALADWGQGIERYTAIVFGAGISFLLPAIAVGHARRVLVVLLILGAAFFLFRSYEAGRTVARGVGPTVDVGTTTIQAGELVRGGQNPYTTYIDPNGAGTNPEGTGFRYAAGFKYGPAMIWAYMPPVALLGHDGYFVLNWIALIGTAIAAFLLLQKESGFLAGVGAFVLALVPGILGRELFEAGFNDIVPVVLALIAFVLRERRYPIAAGIALGLSIATKFIPGVIVVVPMLLMFREDRYKFGIAAVVTAILGHLPYLVMSTPELIAGLVTFNLTRAVDDTSILFWIPGVLRLPFTLLMLGLTLGLSARYAHAARARGIATFVGLVAAALALSFAASPAVHGNYLLWYFPFIGIAVAARLWDRQAG